MKRKAISSLLCVLAILQMSVTPAYATNTTQQTSTPGNQSATITYDQGSKFTVTIPKTISLDKTKTHTYNVKVEGDISADEAVTVTPDATVAMTDTNSKNSVTGTITQEKTKFVATEVNQADGTTTGNISAPDLKAGNWSGQFNFYINVDANKHTHNYVESITKAATCTDTGVKTLTCSCGDTYTETIPATGHNYENGTCTECGAKDPDYVSEEAGLYDADGKLLCTWEDSGINIEKDYNTYKECMASITSAYYVINNNYPATTRIVLDDTTKIGKLAFSDCASLNDIIIPNTVTNISDYAFNRCTSLTNINIPNSITSIGEDVFQGCSSLTSITIPDSVTSIGNGAFASCASLTNINIPNSVTSIGLNAFVSCTSLNNITIPDSVTSIGNGLFKGCTSLTNIIIPDSVTSIADETFYGCTGLTSLPIIDSVTRIGDSAFRGCTGLTEIVLPEKLISIGNNAFSECTNLTSITISDSVTNIDSYAFRGCTGLKNITISNSVKRIEHDAFKDCTNLANAKFVHTSDWVISNAAGNKSISKSDLENSSTAATYLRYKYVSLTWIRLQ